MTKKKTTKADFNKKSGTGKKAPAKKTTKKKPAAKKPEPYTGGVHWCGTMDIMRRNWGRRNRF